MRYKNKKNNSERDSKIYADYISGKFTRKEVALRYNLSDSRIAQIVREQHQLRGDMNDEKWGTKSNQ